MRPSPTPVAILAALYWQGNSLAEVGVLVGIHGASVRERLVKAGIPLRTAQEGLQLAYDKGSRISHGTPGPISDEKRRRLSEAAYRRGEREAKGISLTSDGYYRITRGRHKGRLEHDVVMEEVLGRSLTKDECVHHIDENRINNDPANLRVMSRADHTSLHRKAQREKRGQTCLAV